ncbi:hypothetical protein VIGAN_10013000, partial [Vigna angularis var. angularis]
ENFRQCNFHSVSIFALQKFGNVFAFMFLVFYGSAVFILCTEGSLIMPVRVELKGTKVWGQGREHFQFYIF